MITSTTVTIATRVLAPLIKDIYDGAKRAGLKGFSRWNAPNISEILAKKIIRVESVRTLWQTDKTVRVSDFYYPLSVYDSDWNQHLVEGLESFANPQVVIEGFVGQGKSILLRKLCIGELSAERRSLPVFFEMRTIKVGTSLVQRICQELASFELSDEIESLDYLARSGKLVLMLDGFDELDKELVQHIVLEIENLVEKYPELRILVTSRPGCAIQESATFSVNTICEINDEHHIDFLCKLGFNRTRANTIATAIKESPNEISELISTPLMLTLTVMVYRSEDSIPVALPAFFEALFTTVFTRHDKKKPGFERKHRTELGERSLQLLFEVFCFVCAQNACTRNLTAEEFATFYERASKVQLDKPPSVEAFKHDIVKVACLLLEEGVGDFAFLHKSVAEYFAASFVRRLQEPPAKKFYDDALRNHGRWSGLLQFLEKIDNFRFNKYHFIPERTIFLELLQNSQGDITNNSLKDYIDKIFKDATIEVTDTNGNFRITNTRIELTSISADSVTTLESAFLKEVITRFLEHLPDKFNILDDTNCFSIKRDTASSEYRSGRAVLKSVFKDIGYSSFIAAAKVVVNRIETEIERGKAVLATENRKTDLLEGLI
ncbi:hypothetical protein BLA9940_05409 [Burkholderia aenigmatica]|uniref:NACHT domain-containing protein n=1 Tax=Burkholderia cepacia complex TaxID=87882 RepID=UPI000F08450E|nr:MULTISPECIES: NACHT domain-containing protein [Burkholderia cepacia complex]AYQ41773.1 hypothetical protein CVS37_28000 [Burkholderia lata]VWC90184.1 hypothetical protein BLA9940_05409 [Burkholderia aenigmatica]